MIKCVKFGCARTKLATVIGVQQSMVKQLQSRARPPDPGSEVTCIAYTMCVYVYEEHESVSALSVYATTTVSSKAEFTLASDGGDSEERLAMSD
jgi:hypothetical protein